MAWYGICTSPARSTMSWLDTSFAQLLSAVELLCNILPAFQLECIEMQKLLLLLCKACKGKRGTSIDDWLSFCAAQALQN